MLKRVLVGITLWIGLGWACASTEIVYAQPTFSSATARLNQPVAGLGNYTDAASAIDFNQDGLVDIFRFGHFYVNQGHAVFSDWAGLTGITAPSQRQAGGVWGDYNNDGLVDVALISQTLGNTLYKNQGFSQLDPDIGVLPTTSLRGEAGLWADFNVDGWLDLLVAGTGEAAVFWNQAGESFREERFSVGDPSFRAQAFCVAAASDYDQDGDPDVFLGACANGNGFVRNALLQNEGGSFSDVAQALGILQANDRQDTESAQWFDYNNDGWQDLLVTRRGLGFFAGRGQPLLFENDQQGGFILVDQAAGLLSSQVRSYASIATGDFDNDGWLDVFFGDPSSTRTNEYFHNVGDGTFALANVGLPAGRASVVTTSDFNQDGWLDLWLNELQEDQLFLNNAGTNHWLHVRLVGTTSNRDGVGSRLVAYAQGQRYMREIGAGEGSASQSHGLMAHFGLGTASQVDSLVITWPSGVIDRVTALDSDQYITVIEGQGVNAPADVQLRAPLDGTRFELESDTLLFQWDISQPDSDIIASTFYMQGVGLDTVVTALSGGEIRLPTRLFQEGGRFIWGVEVSDGFVRRQSEPYSFIVRRKREPFLDLVQFELDMFERGDMAFGDWDGDRDLDYAVTGQGNSDSPITRIYTLRDTSFTEEIGEEIVLVHRTKIYRSALTFPGVIEGGLDWVDYDGDGRDELLLHGLTEVESMLQPSATLYAVDARGVRIQARFTGVYQGASDWGDFDNDGDLDLLLAGLPLREANAMPVTYLYRNDNGTFTQVDAGLPGVKNGDVAWGDVDSDGTLDVALMGDTGQGQFITRLYVGDGTGGFSERLPALPGFAYGTLDWADYDRDGDMDLLQTGGQLAPALIRGQTTLYQNQSGVLVAVDQSFGAAYQGEAIWGDYDDDGDPDIIVHGSASVFGEREGLVFLNERGVFRSDEQTRVFGGMQARVQVGDYNGDGDLDVVFAGFNEGRTFLRFFINCQFTEEILPSILPVGINGPIPPCIQ